MAEEHEDTVRAMEMEVLNSMYQEHELQFPYPENPYTFVLLLELSLSDETDQVVACELSCSLPSEYPALPPGVSIQCKGLKKSACDVMKQDLLAALRELDEEQMKILEAVEWLKEHVGSYLHLEEGSGGAKEDAVPPTHKPSKGLMREWCSFVSLYKDSYCSGPNRFEVMTQLATGRGLNVTGMGIAGKPGGLVVEGEENDVVAFMELMRTEFFETLNPRGRKLTTRLQERWPLDGEEERFEIAEIIRGLEEDRYRAADRAAGKVKKPGEAERLEERELRDKERLKRWKSDGNTYIM
eukprot:gene18650-22264_t